MPTEVLNQTLTPWWHISIEFRFAEVILPIAWTYNAGIINGMFCVYHQIIRNHKECGGVLYPFGEYNFSFSFRYYNNNNQVIHPRRPSWASMRSSFVSYGLLLISLSLSPSSFFVYHHKFFVISLSFSLSFVNLHKFFVVAPLSSSSFFVYLHKFFVISLSFSLSFVNLHKFFVASLSFSLSYMCFFKPHCDWLVSSCGSLLMCVSLTSVVIDRSAPLSLSATPRLNLALGFLVLTRS